MGLLDQKGCAGQQHAEPAQEHKARAVVAGDKAARAPRFVKTRNGAQELDEASLQRARRLVGLKGYVTNIEAALMPAAEVIANYHDLWRVEQSFRMSRSDLAARPMFARTRDAIESPPHHRVHRPRRQPRSPYPNRTIATAIPAHPQATAVGHYRNQRRDHHIPTRAGPRSPGEPQRAASPQLKALSPLTQLGSPRAGRIRESYRHRGPRTFGPVASTAASTGRYALADSPSN
ncbi:hypothetical protein M2272_002830 [Mycobacterium frederiksbergense]|uniref:Transposase IS4-like domain-containing protein n=1 Tax=Mycolicibacterium frederiksbergense TaxID=117567 RepID=A0ABT6L1U5_9MYCO|nr:hypothetical protein [Mycolicibacterium frederiksbergense]